MLRLQFKLVIGFFAGLLLLAYTLPYMHEVASGWEGLLAKCIPGLMQYTRDELGATSKGNPDIVPWHDSMAGALGLDQAKTGQIVPESIFPSGSKLKLSGSFWARPPPGFPVLSLPVPVPISEV